MVVFGWQIDYAEILERTGSQRAVKRIGKALHEQLGAFWHQDILPRHWDPGASAHYGYQARTIKWLKRKEQLAARGWASTPILDLRLSGEMEEELTTHAWIRAFPTRFSIRMAGPYYVTMHPADPFMPHLFDEATKMSPRDDRHLMGVAESLLPQLIEADPATKRKRRKKIK